MHCRSSSSASSCFSISLRSISLILPFVVSAGPDGRKRLSHTVCQDWWPNHPAYTLLYPVAKMLLQIPDSSAENERSFSSASFILDQRRTRLDIDNFRREHRIRRALVAGRSQEEKLQCSNELIQRFAEAIAELKAAAPLGQPQWRWKSSGTVIWRCSSCPLRRFFFRLFSLLKKPLKNTYS